MGNDNKKPKIIHNQTKIPQSATKIKPVDDTVQYVGVRFGSCDDNKLVLHDWQKSEIKQFIKTVKKLEGMTWVKAKSDPGFQIKTIKNKKPPKYLSQDISLQEIRVTQKARLHGYYFSGHFHILWFDNNHEVCK